MRKNTPFPLENTPMTGFLKKAWDNGWLDEFSDQHFLIRVMQNRLKDFVGMRQLSTNNLAIFCPVKENGEYDLVAFSNTFCINLSTKLAEMAAAFGEDAIKRFITDQLSAGKQCHYSEDAFLQALSEISILTFWLSRGQWDETLYEPRVRRGVNNKNPEASFVCHIGTTDKSITKSIKINIEVKTPEFPHDHHDGERVLIPSILLSEQGRRLVQKFCQDNSITYLPPRVLKLVEFINSAAEKFEIPKENELNLLYINWSYRDYPSNGFLEAASLLSNPYNGLLCFPDISRQMNIAPNAFQKISGIIVYTESLEGIMFTDYRHVWQHNGAGPRFRLYTLDQNIKQDICQDTREFVFQLTGMNPCDPEKYMALMDFKNTTDEESQKAQELSRAYQALMLEEAIL